MAISFGKWLFFVYICGNMYIYMSVLIAERVVKTDEGYGNRLIFRYVSLCEYA